MSQGETCELQVAGKGDCGRQATQVVMAGPKLGRDKPFYACQDHGEALQGDLRSMGWRAGDPRPLT